MTEHLSELGNENIKRAINEKCNSSRVKNYFVKFAFASGLINKVQIMLSFMQSV